MFGIVTLSVASKILPGSTEAVGIKFTNVVYKICSFTYITYLSRNAQNKAELFAFLSQRTTSATVPEGKMVFITSGGFMFFSKSVVYVLII